MDVLGSSFSTRVSIVLRHNMVEQSIKASGISSANSAKYTQLYVLQPLAQSKLNAKQRYKKMITSKSKSYDQKPTILLHIGDSFDLMRLVIMMTVCDINKQESLISIINKRDVGQLLPLLVNQRRRLNTFFRIKH